MGQHIIFDSKLTKADCLVLKSLAADALGEADPVSEAVAVETLKGLNDETNAIFEPTITNNFDLNGPKLPTVLQKFLVQPYVVVARRVVRYPTDVVMLTHLLVYFSTSLPSAILLFRHTSPTWLWVHGGFHFVMQAIYVGTFTLMRHQHIHQRGALSKRFPFSVIDALFPYVLDPLMGHTWNSYFYHHVKHHHIEGNGPGDLSSTIRYQRDELLHFLHYLGRFILLVGVELPLYFIRKKRWALAFKTFFWDQATLVSIGLSYYYVNKVATFFAFILPLVLTRLGLMMGNWGQHAFIDADEPDSDYRSSITLIDVSSNRECFNDGYHTSHHLNPLRHWRDHPVALLETKDIYASQNALVLHNIDYMMLTVRLLMKDYATLAKCMVPLGPQQIAMTLEERAEYLRRHTRKFTEDEIRQKFRWMKTQ